MATFPNVNVPTLKPAATPTNNALTAAGDQFAAQPGAKYLLRFINGSATPGNVVLNDPVSVAPGDSTTFDPDVTVPIPAGQVRTIRVEANRFRDPITGMIAWTYSANITNAASVVEIYGPE